MSINILPEHYILTPKTIRSCTHMVNMSVRSGRHLRRVPADMRRPVRRMEALSPLASKNQRKGDP